MDVDAYSHEVLRICRSGLRKDGKPQNGIWCMRELSERHPQAALGRCAIVDNARWDGRIVVQGNTWREVLERMP